jgi:Protein of unknown function (DUF3168)
MEEAIIDKLLASSGVTALVQTRVYPGTRAQGSALPAIVFNMISANPSYSDDGEDGISEARIQLDCWGASYSSAKKTARAVKAALSAFQGVVSGVNIRYIALDLEHDLREAGGDAADYPFRTSLDFLVVFDN